MRRRPIATRAAPLRAATVWIAASLCVTFATLLQVRHAGASCDVIPPAALTFRGTTGDLDRPFARPGDWVKLTLDPACHGSSSPGFSGTAADLVVTVVFTPPNGPRNVLALAASCAGVDTATCAARPDVATAACIEVNGAGSPPGLERLDQRTMRFRFPDSDAQLLPPGDRRTFTGPATVAVTAAGAPLPCELASSACGGQSGLLGCVDALFADDRTCDTTPSPSFSHFTALPHSNNYQGLCTAPAPPCSGAIDELRITVDAAGNALIPMDWRGILVRRDAVPIARLLLATTDLEAFEGRGVAVSIPDLASLSSYSPAGVRLPPLFDPQFNPAQADVATFFGSADAPETVLRIARHLVPSRQCAAGPNADLPCRVDSQCPGSTCAAPVCVGGDNSGDTCAFDAECPGGECGVGLFDFSTRLASGAGPIVLRLGACIGGSNPLATCTDDSNCPGGQCGDFSFAALDPVPLDGLSQSAEANVFVMEEAIDNPPVDLNGDGDAIDTVIKLANRTTGAIEMIGGGGSQARAVVRIQQPPFSFPAVAVEGDVVAFLVPEPRQGALDANANGSVFDTTLEVFRIGAGEVTNPGQPLTADAAPLIGGRSLAISAGRVFFRTVEAAAAQQETTAASVDSSGSLATGGTQLHSPSLSGDGRYVAFASNSPSLTQYGTPTVPIYVHVRDRVAGTTTLVSVTHNGQQSNGASIYPVISANGRHIAFNSNACDHIPGDCVSTGDTNAVQDVFVRDRDTDGNGIFDEPGGMKTARVSVASNGTQGNAASGSDRLSISADGRYVAFVSKATNLVPGDTNDSCDPGGTGNCTDVFVHDRDADANGIFDEPGSISTVRLSISSSGDQGGDLSDRPSISADGRFVAFESYAANLVDGDTNAVEDVFLHDRDTDADGVFDEPGAISTVRVSVDSTGAQGNARSYDPKLSADGCCVVFTSRATNLAAGTDGHAGTYVHERSSGITTMISRNPQGSQAAGNGGAGYLSADGRYVAFNNNAHDLVEPPLPEGITQLYVHDRLTNLTVLGSLNSAGEVAADRSPPTASLSADGRHVAFISLGDNLTANDTNGADDAFVRGPADSGDLSGDGATDDTVLQVLDTTSGSPATVTGICPAEAVAVSGGNAAFLRPESAGQTPNLAACPIGTVLADGKPDLNADGDTDDQVVHLWTGTTVQNLGRAATVVQLSTTLVAALVSEAAEGDADINGDGDSTDTVVQVYPLATGAWTSLYQAADDLALAGNVVAFITPESAQDGTDLNGDGDDDDRVVQVYDAATASLTNLGQAAEEIVVGDQGLVAFRTREAAQGGQVLNDDGDTDDGVLQVFDPVSGVLVNSGYAVTPCRLEACDPRLPYRVGSNTVTFLTLESDQGQDLNDDGDLEDLVLQVFNVRQALVNGTPLGASHSLAAVVAGTCTDTSEACASDDSCPAGKCFVPPGGCLRNTGTACNPTTVGNSCFDDLKFCQPLPGMPTQGTCIAKEGACTSDADCTAPAVCNDAAQSFQRLMNPLAPQDDGSSVFTGSGRCVENFGNACTHDSQCGAGEFCEQGTCHRQHGVCAGDAACPTGAVCRPELVRATAADRDNDEVPDAVDNCPDKANVEQTDADGDGIGDLCDASVCGNGTREPGETCDDGNRQSGDGCPATCIDAGSLIRGNGSSPSRSRSCQVEWHAENPGNPLDRHGLPSHRQDCVDQDPTCDFDPAPGICRFQVAVCLNNEDPNLPACVPNGVGSLIVRQPKGPRTKNLVMREATLANLAALQHALGHLLDPADPEAGYVSTPPLSAAQRNLCSAPFAIDVPLEGRSKRNVKLVTESKDTGIPSRGQRSQLRLSCLAP